MERGRPARFLGFLRAGRPRSSQSDLSSVI